MKVHPRHYLNARFTRAVVSCLWALLWCITPASVADEKKDLSSDKSSLQSQLQSALFAEEATRDLPAAAAAYEKLLIDYATQRQLAATALFRLAEVRRKQDQKDAAIKLYQRLLTEFPDTEPQARLSRENLTALGVKDIPAPGQLTAPAIPMDPDEERELNRLKTLLENGPDRVLEDVPATAIQNDNGSITDFPPSTPLVNAARKGWKQTVIWLLDHKADPNEYGKQGGGAPLHAAAANGHTVICEILRTRGAKISTADGALSKAIAQNYRETAEWLMKNGCNIDAIGQFRCGKDPLTNGTPLLAAVLTENQVWLTRLLEAKADPNITDEGSIAPLHAAAYLGNTKFLQQLLKTGADSNLADKGRGFREHSSKSTGWTALHYAVKHPDIVKLLLAAGAKVDAEDLGSWRPLHLACAFDYTESAILLIEAGADVKTPAKQPDPRWGPEAFLTAANNNSFKDSKDNEKRTTLAATGAEQASWHFGKSIG